MRVLLFKLTGIAGRFIDAIRFLPIRIQRLSLLILVGLQVVSPSSGPPLPLNRFAQWWIELSLLILDVVALPEWYETFMDFWKWKTRPLSQAELEIARSIFYNSIHYNRIRVDESAHVGCKKHHIYYVSFFTINGWGRIQNDIFVHELMHVWQFQMLGSVYIIRALLAQRTSMGYNYGGLPALKYAHVNNLGLAAFNLEQQADIVSDYYCLQNGLMPRWVTPADLKLIASFDYFIEKIRLKNMQ